MKRFIGSPYERSDDWCVSPSCIMLLVLPGLSQTDWIAFLLNAIQIFDIDARYNKILPSVPVFQHLRACNVDLIQHISQ